jgi:hypothetical protein
MAYTDGQNYFGSGYYSTGYWAEGFWAVPTPAPTVIALRVYDHGVWLDVLTTAFRVQCTTGEYIQPSVSGGTITWNIV